MTCSPRSPRATCHLHSMAVGVVVFHGDDVVEFIRDNRPEPIRSLHDW